MKLIGWLLMASLCAGLSVTWPLQVARNLVPNS